MLDPRVASSIRNDAVPMGWHTGIHQFIKPRVVGMVSSRSTVRIDGHTRDEEEGLAVRQLPERHFLKMLRVSTPCHSI